MAENRSTANDVFGVFGAVLTLGLSCYVGANPCRSSGATSTTTATDGTFQFSVAAVTEARGTSNGLVLTAAVPGAGGFTVKLNPTAGGDLGDIVLWDPDVAVGQGRGDTIRILAAAPEGADRRTVVDGLIDGVVGVKHTGRDFRTEVDPRAIEDGPGALSLRAGFSRPRAGQTPRIDWASAPVGVGPGAGAPPSRGKPCTQSFADDVALPGCVLTDGDRSKKGPGLRSATIDMGAELHVGPVAVIGAVDTVDLSSDGQVWKRAGEARRDERWSAQLFDGGGESARYVRVSAAGSEVAEVSVWPAGRPPIVAAAPDGGLPQARRLPDASSSIPRLLLIFATAAPLAPIGFLVLSRLRRRSRAAPDR